MSRSRSIAASSDNAFPPHVMQAIGDSEGCNVWMGAAVADANGNQQQSRSTAHISFRSLGSQLVRHFAQVMGGQARLRPLGREELEFLGGSNRLWGRAPGADNPKPTVSAASFATFWSWFQVRHSRQLC